MTTGVIGLGKLGLPFALTYARGSSNTVLVWDSDVKVRDAVRKREPHIDEPRVAEMLAAQTLEVVHPDEMAQRADVIFVVVPTPSMPSGAFDPLLVIEAIKSLGDDPHRSCVISVVSTLSPGSLTNDVKPVTDGRGFKLAYTPTLIALGSVVRDLTYPDVQILGCDDTQPDVALRMASRLRLITNAPIVPMSFESAAIAKLASNVFVTMKISFANTLAQLCDCYQDANVDDVTHAIGYNKRIGPRALTAGAGFGGPCFPRDVAAFEATGVALSDPDYMNNEHLNYVFSRTMEHLNPLDLRSTTIAVLGRAYKDGAHHRIESFGDRLAAEFEEAGAHVVDVDNVRDADVVVVAQPCEDVNLLGMLKKGALVYDLWRRHDYVSTVSEVTYLPLGVGVTR